MAATLAPTTWDRDTFIAAGQAAIDGADRDHTAALRRIVDHFDNGDLIDGYRGTALLARRTRHCANPAVRDAVLELCAQLPRSDDTTAQVAAGLRVRNDALVTLGHEVDRGWRLGGETIPTAAVTHLSDIVDALIIELTAGRPLDEAFEATDDIINTFEDDDDLTDRDADTIRAAITNVADELSSGDPTVVMLPRRSHRDWAEIAYLLHHPEFLIDTDPNPTSICVVPDALAVIALGRVAGPALDSDTAEIYELALGLWDPLQDGSLRHPDVALDVARHLNGHTN